MFRPRSPARWSSAFWAALVHRCSAANVLGGEVGLLPSKGCVGALLLGALPWAGAAPALCHAPERVVFACQAGVKTVSLCALGDLRADAGRLIYRFGRDAAHIELEYGLAANPLQSGYRFDYSPWGKGESVTVQFRNGVFTYLVNHAAGAFGVDGGPNVASVRVQRDGRDLAEIPCHEPSATDHLYQELAELGLPSS